jgi:hypothetical protein
MKYLFNILYFRYHLYSQKKVLQTKFTTDNITIDGKLDEPYGNPPQKLLILIMGGQFPKIKTIVKVIYDNDAIYVAALLYDDEPDKIRKEISQRDSFGISDVFGVFNGFNDGQQDFSFLSTLLMDNQTA